MQDLKEVGFIVLIIVAVIAGLQWFLLRFAHWSVSKMFFILPFCLVVAIAASLYLYKYVRSSKLFSKCQIEVQNKSNTIPKVREITFKSSTSGAETDLQITFNKLAQVQISSPSTIPRLTDQVVFNCYSEETQRSFLLKFPFDYSLCEEVILPNLGVNYERFLFNQKAVLPITLLFLPGENVQLLLGGNLVNQYRLSEKEEADL